jgi:hypothetical protein
MKNNQFIQEKDGVLTTNCGQPVQVEGDVAFITSNAGDVFKIDLIRLPEVSDIYWFSVKIGDERRIRSKPESKKNNAVITRSVCLGQYLLDSQITKRGKVSHLNGDRFDYRESNLRFIDLVAPRYESKVIPAVVEEDVVVEEPIVEVVKESVVEVKELPKKEFVFEVPEEVVEALGVHGFQDNLDNYLTTLREEVERTVQDLKRGVFVKKGSEGTSAQAGLN